MLMERRAHPGRFAWRPPDHLAHQPVLAEQEAVIGNEDDRNRIFDAEIRELIDEMSDPAIQQFELATTISHMIHQRSMVECHMVRFTHSRISVR